MLSLIAKKNVLAQKNALLQKSNIFNSVLRFTRSDSTETKPVSICPAGTPLNLKIKVNQEEPVALEDKDYPDWLWTIMEEEKITKDISPEDELKIRKRNISHDRKRDIRSTIELLKNQ